MALQARTAVDVYAWVSAVTVKSRQLYRARRSRVLLFFYQTYQRVLNHLSQRSSGGDRVLFRHTKQFTI